MLPYITYNETMDIVIDKIAIWTANFQNGLTVRKNPAGLRYKTEDGVYAIADKPIYRFAKDYKVGKTRYTLFVRTFDDNVGVVEKALDKVAKGLKEDFVKEKIANADVYNFEYLDFNIKGEK